MRPLRGRPVTADIADATGKSEHAIRRDAERGGALDDDLGAVAGTFLGKGVELDALAKLNRAEPRGQHREAADSVAIARDC